jgi:ubiquitin carboxyl-terminal hydrolase 4/11/15
MKYTVTLTSDQSILNVLEHISRTAALPLHQLDPVMIKDHQIKERVAPAQTVKWINEHEGILFVHQVERRSSVLGRDETEVLLYFKQKA